MDTATFLAYLRALLLTIHKIHVKKLETCQTALTFRYLFIKSHLFLSSGSEPGIILGVGDAQCQQL